MTKPSKEDLILIPVVIFGVVMIVLTIITYHGKSETSVIEETTTTETTTTEETITTTTEMTTTTKDTTTTEETTTTTTTTTEVTTTTTTTTVVTTSASELTLLGSFKGTYYAGNTVPCKGGSGRTLIDCSTGSSGIKGSVASKFVYHNYGYKRNGERTKIYIEVESIPSMTGWYYVDDCNAANSIIDFYYYRNSNCPFQRAGVISVKAYI